MCWSAPASLAIGAVGVGAAAYGHKKSVGYGFTMPIAFFSMMEFIQFFSYFFIGQCSFSANSWLTLISYIHISLHPVFMNMYFLHFYPRSWFTKMLVYSTTGSISIILLLKLIPFPGNTLCQIGQTLCGSTWCTVQGNWHLAWSIPYHIAPTPFDIVYYYVFGFFIVPLMYRAWKPVLYTSIVGPTLAYYLASGNPQEWPAVWCLLSVPALLIGLKELPAVNKATRRFKKALVQFTK